MSSLVVLVVFIAVVCLIVVCMSVSAQVSIVEEWTKEDARRKKIQELEHVTVLSVSEDVGMICMAPNPSDIIDDLGRTINARINPLDDSSVICRELVNAINAGNFGWTATADNFFKDVSVTDAAKYAGTIIPPTIEEDDEFFEESNIEMTRSTLPERFDAREQWPDCMCPIRNQGECGSCWAFATTTVLSEILCIKRRTQGLVVLSPQYLVATSGTKCNGNQISNGVSMLRSGVVSESCRPYDITAVSSIKNIRNQCVDPGERFTLYRSSSGDKLKYSSKQFEQTVATIKGQIITNGPVVATMTVFRCFYTYKTGVYRQSDNTLVGGHAVTILGWGRENINDEMVDYWICSNSWSEGWGEEGYFKIRMGECGIEKNVYAITV